MALKTFVANVGRAATLAAIAVAALSLGAVDADAQQQTRKKNPRAYYGPVQGSNNPNYSYMSGPRTRVYVTRRSWLDAGTEVQPGERKFTDYALAPGYSYGRIVDPRFQYRTPLSEPLDLGGYPTAFPLY